MESFTLSAISPLDGRYESKIHSLKNIFSEFGLMRFRVLIEIRWLQSLAKHPEINELPPFSESENIFFENMITNFSLEDAKYIKKLERKTNHDVKAVEYFIKEKMRARKKLKSLDEFVHFACTSEDINNLAYGLMLQTSFKDVLTPIFQNLIASLIPLLQDGAKQPMLSRTHGQPASPTTLGKEIANIVYRLNRQILQINHMQFLGKINGAVGNYNAHLAAYPNIDWPAHAESFVKQLGLEWNPYTTQIEPHDYISEALQGLMRLNTVLIDYVRDIWGYVSLGYFTQRISPHETGSSTMPHKINPINFENAEGNLGIGNAIMQHLANSLPTSRWQRDLTDSTTMRNLGVGIGYSYIAYQEIIKGNTKLSINPLTIENDLNNTWEVLAEPIQTVMRRYGVEQPYEKLKSLTRNNEKITRETLVKFINSLTIPQTEKDRLKTITPLTYIGNAEKQSQDLLGKYNVNK